LHLSDVLPDAEAVVSLDTEELGTRILQVLAKWPPHSGMTIEVGSFVRGALQGYSATPRREEMRRAIEEAWAWLEGQGFLIPDNHYGGSHGIKVLSRKARALASEGLERALRTRRFPKDMLHPCIREDVWELFQRGKYDTAVFEAMRAVEVAVRDAAGLTDRDIGTALMRTAFDVNNGPLTDLTAVPAERQAMSDLFAGTIGTFKNPHSHRKLALNNPDETAEIILIASHLLRIVEARQPNQMPAAKVTH
jgi:uncharacterized protein (TIGR02391 family)